MNPSEATRHRILDAADELAREEGLNGITMRKIARKTGLSAPAAYRHFPGKEALLEALISRGYETFVRGLEQRLLTVDSAGERLEAACLYYLEFWDADPAGFQVLTGRENARKELSGEAIRRGSLGSLPVMASAVADSRLDEEERERRGRWTAAALYGLALSLSADPPEIRNAGGERQKELLSAARFLLRSILSSVIAEPDRPLSGGRRSRK